MTVTPAGGKAGRKASPKKARLSLEQFSSQETMFCLQWKFSEGTVTTGSKQVLNSHYCFPKTVGCSSGGKFRVSLRDGGGVQNFDYAPQTPLHPAPSRCVTWACGLLRRRLSFHPHELRSPSGASRCSRRWGGHQKGEKADSHPRSRRRGRCHGGRTTARFLCPAFL